MKKWKNEKKDKKTKNDRSLQALALEWPFGSYIFASEFWLDSNHVIIIPFGFFISVCSLIQTISLSVIKTIRPRT